MQEQDKPLRQNPAKIHFILSEADLTQKNKDNK